MNKTQHSSIAARAMRVYNKEILRQWKWSMPTMALVVIGTIAIFYVPPLIIADIIRQDTAVTLSNGLHYVILFAGSWLLGEILWRIAFFLLARFESESIRRLYNDAMSQLIEKDLSFYADHFAGSITKNTIAYGKRFESYVDTLTFGIIAQVGPAIFGIVILAIISPLLAVTLAGLTTLTLLLVRPLIQRRSKLVKKREAASTRMSGHISDVISNISAVKAAGAEKEELLIHEKYTRRFANAAYESWQYHNLRIDTLISPIYVLANTLALVIIMSTGIDTSTKASLFLAFNYFMSITRFMWEFNSIYRRIEESLTDAGLFIQYSDHVTGVIDKPHAQTLSVSSGAIDIRNIRFAHSDNDTEVLFEKFSLQIPAGQRVGLVGHSGAGKSTLVNLVLRFSPLDDGSIYIDDQDISTVTQESLHKSIAFVQQEPALFHRSLGDNISYGTPSASKSEIRTAAKRAHALEFIKKLPDGFDTMVGERGIKLSGGQRQRIAIARAILKDAPILILDEATSALDSESEVLIQKALDELMKGRTSIVIAHRLSTIAKLDRIIVLDDGKIVEDGTHAELLAANKTYATLWSHQSGGFIEE